MIKTHIIKLESIIQDPGLKPVIEQVNKIKKANKRLKHFLPHPLSDHVIISNIKGKTLILQTSSPAWSTRTNFIATEILNYMRNEGGLAMVERMKVKVIPPREESNTNINSKARSVEPISKHTSDLLKSVASGIEDDDLSDVLERLSSHFRNGQDAS